MASNPQSRMFHLWNWKLCRFIPLKVRQSSTFCISIHPKSFIKMAFVGVVDLSIPVLFPLSPAAFIPISICLHMRRDTNLNPLSTLIYNHFQSQIPVQDCFLTVAHDSMSVTLILHPLSLINVSILIAHLSPTTTLVLDPEPLINS